MSYGVSHHVHPLAREAQGTLSRDSQRQDDYVVPKLRQAVTSEELQPIIDEEHLKAFGITREERQLKRKLATADDEQDWDKYYVRISERLQLISSTSAKLNCGCVAKRFTGCV